MKLTAPGAPFEMEVQEVPCTPMQVFEQRAKSLRARRSDVLGVDQMGPARGATLGEAELEAWCREALAACKVPTRWWLREEPPPRNLAGKLQETVLRGADVDRFTDLDAASRDGREERA